MPTATPEQENPAESVPGAAATGTLGAGGWVVFGILAAWQMPHFLTLAWMYREDYTRGGYRMLPVVEPEGDSTARQTLLFTSVLFAMALTPAALGLAGGLYLAGAFLLGLWFLETAVDFYRSHSE